MILGRPSELEPPWGVEPQTYALRVDLQVSTPLAIGDFIGLIHSFGTQQRQGDTHVRGQLRGHANELVAICAVQDPSQVQRGLGGHRLHDAARHGLARTPTTPIASAAVTGRSATHSAIATNERATRRDRANSQGEHDCEPIASSAGSPARRPPAQRRAQERELGNRIGFGQPFHLIDEVGDRQRCGRGHGSLPDGRAWRENRKITHECRARTRIPAPRVAAAQRLLTTTLPTPAAVSAKITHRRESDARSRARCIEPVHGRRSGVDRSSMASPTSTKPAV
jgi:hypothetical protein